MKKFTHTLLLIAFNIGICKATIITVPGNFSSIQQAIDASVDGDTVVVLQGTYLENLNFHGKKILLTSLFYLSNDTSYISTTIINGSQPVQPDTASCVLMISGEDSTTILQGFTITGGTGTKWLDEHGAGTYREGGGILIQYSSPVIRHNAIIYNYAVDISGVFGAGGGGLRIGDSHPQILNNVIANNEAKYGPGIVLNYTGCTIKNNLICFNSGGQYYNGGGAVWANHNPAVPDPKIIENNTIYANHATTGTGGILCSGTSVIMRNNIIRNNTSPNNSQVYPIGGGLAVVTYTDIQGGYAGSGNIDTDALFTDTTTFYLLPLSPCIDAGDSSAIYNDIENVSLPGFALLPSLGTIRNDMGAYGGQGAFNFGQVQTVGINEQNVTDENHLSIFPNPASERFTVSCFKFRVNRIEMINAVGEIIFTVKPENKNEVTMDVTGLQKGIYFMKLMLENTTVTKKIVVN
ncbi:MAG: T9SS type A sorting domain-containing protein [Bacteroidia bacterium]